MMVVMDIDKMKLRRLEGKMNVERGKTNLLKDEIRKPFEVKVN